MTADIQNCPSQMVKQFTGLMYALEKGLHKNHLRTSQESNNKPFKVDALTAHWTHHIGKEACLLKQHAPQILKKTLLLTQY